MSRAVITVIVNSWERCALPESSKGISNTFSTYIPLSVSSAGVGVSTALSVSSAGVGVSTAKERTIKQSSKKSEKRSSLFSVCLFSVVDAIKRLYLGGLLSVVKRSVSENRTHV